MNNLVFDGKNKDRLRKGQGTFWRKVEKPPQCLAQILQYCYPQMNDGEEDVSFIDLFAGTCSMGRALVRHGTFFALAILLSVWSVSQQSESQ